MAYLFARAVGPRRLARLAATLGSSAGPTTLCRSLCAAGVDRAEEGMRVTINFEGKLDDGSVFGSSDGRGPLRFSIGKGEMMSGIENGVKGMQVGDEKDIIVEAKEGFGERDESLVTTDIPVGELPPGAAEGKGTRYKGNEGLVTKIAGGKATVDMNHPLAGKRLTFHVILENCDPPPLLTPEKKVTAMRERAAKGEVAAKDEEGYALATFAGGCFWGPQILFDRIEGVVGTAVGYAMGEMDNPDYEAVCSGMTGHTEAVQVCYDPKVVSYETLLKEFWEKIDPTTVNGQENDFGTQYRTGVYFHTEEQGKFAKASLAEVQKKYGDAKIATEVLQAKVFWPGEDHHQNYLVLGGRFGDAQSTAKGCKDPIRCYG